MNAPSTADLQLAAACGIRPRHRAIDCEACGGRGYRKHGQDLDACQTCDATGGVVERCDGLSQEIGRSCWLPAGCALPRDIRELKQGLLGDAHDANDNGHADERNALLLAGDAAEHLLLEQSKAHAAEVAKLNERVRQLAEQLAAAREGAASLKVSLEIEHRVREQDELTRRELVDANAAEREHHNEELKSLHEYVERLEGENEQLRLCTPGAAVAVVDAVAGAAS